MPIQGVVFELPGAAFADASMPILLRRASYTQPYLAEMEVQPDNDRINIIDQLIDSLVTADVWDKLTGLWLQASHTAQAARLNVVDPGVHSLTDTSEPTPVFTVDRGFVGALNTGLHIASQDSGHIGIWPLINQQEVNAMIGNENSAIRPRGTSDECGGRINATSPTTSVTNTDGSGYWCQSRTGASAGSDRLYKHGALLATGTTTSVTTGTSTVWTNGRQSPSQASTNRFAITHMGFGLTADDVAALHAAFGVYLDAVGAI